MAPHESASAQHKCLLLFVVGLLHLAACAHQAKGLDLEQTAREMGARSPLVIARTSELAADYRLTGATYAIDGHQFWQEGDDAGLPREAPVFEGKIVDGEHTLTVTLVGERRTDGKKWEVEESVTFAASPTTATTIDVVAHKSDTGDASGHEHVRIRFDVDRTRRTRPRHDEGP